MAFEDDPVTDPTLTRRRFLQVGAGGALALAGILSFDLGSSAEAATRLAGAKPVKGGTLSFGLSTDTAIIDPSITGSSITGLITRQIVDSLVGQAEDGSFTPWLAESWKVNATNTLFTFHLRKGVTFSDGTPLDAAAVKYNFDRILNPSTQSSYAVSLLGPIKAVEAPSSSTVTFSYSSPFAPLLQALSLPYLGIQSPTYLKKTKVTTNTVVGSGPFVLQSFKPGTGSVLTRRADYKWGPGFAKNRGPSYLDEISFKYLPEASTRLGALQSGELQAIDEVPPANEASIKNSSTLKVVTYSNPGVPEAYFLNTSKGPFADVRVRQAFQAAIDVPTAVKAAYLGTLKPADNILAPNTLDYDAAVAKEWGYNAKKAASLLDAAGWKTGSNGFRSKDGKQLTVKLVYDTTSTPAGDVTMAQFIQAEVKQVGFDLQLGPTDSGGYTQQTDDNDYDLVTFFFVRAEPDILRTVFYSGYIPPKGSDVSHVKDLDSDLLKAIGASAAERKTLYAAVQNEVIKKAYAVPLYVAAYQLGASKSLNGITWATNAKPQFYDAWLSN